jgi:NDP-sugar pyrophosphorylase family protein
MVKSDIQLIIPMSGMGKRFLEAGYTHPKPLIKVDGKPMIEHIVNLFPGVNNVNFICNTKHLNETNMKEILNEISPGCAIFEVPPNSCRGPVEAILSIKDYIDNDKPVIVSYCDYNTEWDFEQFIEDSSNLDGNIACYKGFHPHMLGIDNYAFCREKDNYLLEIKEKEPFTDSKMNEYASNGTYFFKSGFIVKKYFSKLIQLNNHVNGEFYVSLVYNLLVEDKLNVGIFEIKKMLQWGTPYDLEIYKSWSKYFNSSQKTLQDNFSTLILPMAGYGSRFSEQNYLLPKPFLEINKKPMFIQAIDCLPKTKEAMFICLNEHLSKYDIKTPLTDIYQKYKILGINNVTLGQAITCKLGIEEYNLNPNTPIMISACDNGVTYNVEKYEKLLNDISIDVIVWSFRNNQSSKNSPHSYSWLDVDKNNNVKYVSCKKFIYDNPLTTHAIIGTMFFRKCSYFLEGLNENITNNITTNSEYYVDDVINRCIDRGLNVKVFEVDNYICWGTPDDYLTYIYWEEYFKQN